MVIIRKILKSIVMGAFETTPTGGLMDLCVYGMMVFAPTGQGMADLEHIAAAALTLKEGGPGRIGPYFVPRILTNMAAGLIAMRHGLRGPNHSVSTACATGSHSIGPHFFPFLLFLSYFPFYPPLSFFSRLGRESFVLMMKLILLYFRVKLFRELKETR